MLERELSRIDKLGFTTTISWGDYIQISHRNDGVGLEDTYNEVFIMMYSYTPNDVFSFDQSVTEVINIFNSWYYNYTIGNKLEGMGNINDMVNRSLKIEDIIYN